MAARGSSFGAKIFVFCRSGHGSNGCISFVKFFSDLYRFEREIRGLLEICGRVWRCVVVRGGSVVDDFFLDFVHQSPLKIYVG